MNSIECLEGRTAPMATLTIRNLEESNKDKLRLQAASHGRSLAEVREGIGSRIQAHLARLGGVELELPDRTDHPCAQPFA
jgi:plasmid stability protein